MENNIFQIHRVKLTSKTKKGEIIIKRDGDEFRIVREGNPLCMQSAPSIFIKPINAHHIAASSRWVRIDNDEDFIVESIGG